MLLLLFIITVRKLRSEHNSLHRLVLDMSTFDTIEHYAEDIIFIYIVRKKNIACIANITYNIWHIFVNISQHLTRHNPAFRDKKRCFREVCLVTSSWHVRSCIPCISLSFPALFPRDISSHSASSCRSQQRAGQYSAYRQGE